MSRVVKESRVRKGSRVERRKQGRKESSPVKTQADSGHQRREMD
jgi:hypothetical protein